MACGGHDYGRPVLCWPGLIFIRKPVPTHAQRPRPPVTAARVRGPPVPLPEPLAVAVAVALATSGCHATEPSLARGR